MRRLEAQVGRAQNISYWKLEKVKAKRKWVGQGVSGVEAMQVMICLLVMFPIFVVLATMFSACVTVCLLGVLIKELAKVVWKWLTKTNR